MMLMLDIALFLLIAWLCWRGYTFRQPWMGYLGRLLARVYQGDSFIRQLLGFAPLIVGWLLLCHWLNTHGAHGLAAGGILLAMTLALDAMRAVEEKQKREKKP